MAEVQSRKAVALLHAAGYAGRELVTLLAGHPNARLALATSRTYAGKTLEAAHPMLRGLTDLRFSDPADGNLAGMDAVLLAAEHGAAARTVQDILAGGYDGPIIDLSADFRFKSAAQYEARFGAAHPAPELLGRFTYGLAEVCAPYRSRLIANPGCFATGIALALWPVVRALGPLHASVTALTGASGAGTRPKATTHFPTRDGNLRAYRTLNHQHLPEALQLLGPGSTVAFVPVSGPWTRGIWGTAHVTLPAGVTQESVSEWFAESYGEGRAIRLWPSRLPELRFAVGTPYCDIGWVVRRQALVVGFALDNLLKGAASQAVQNLNLVMGWPEMAGLIPKPASA